MNVPVKVDYELLTDMLGKQFAKIRVMEEDLEIKDIGIHYDKERMHVSANIKGSVSGVLNAQFLPRLDAASQKLFLDQLNYDIKSSSFLVKAAVFLFKGKIDKQLEKFSIIDLKPICSKMIKDLNTKLSEITLEGLTFDLKMNNIELTDLSLFENHFMSHITIKADGRIEGHSTKPIQGVN